MDSLSYMTRLTCEDRGTGNLTRLVHAETEQSELVVWQLFGELVLPSTATSADELVNVDWIPVRVTLHLHRGAQVMRNKSDEVRNAPLDVTTTAPSGMTVSSKVWDSCPQYAKKQG